MLSMDEGEKLKHSQLENLKHMNIFEHHWLLGKFNLHASGFVNCIKQRYTSDWANEKTAADKIHYCQTFNIKSKWT